MCNNQNFGVVFLNHFLCAIMMYFLCYSNICFAQSVSDLSKARAEYAEVEKAFKVAEVALQKSRAIYANVVEKSRKTVPAKTLAVYEKALEGSPAQVEIISVKYGYGTEVVDVTKTVQLEFNKSRRISSNGAKLKIPDPAFGKVKFMYVELRVNGANSLLLLPEGGEAKF